MSYAIFTTSRWLTLTIAGALLCGQAWSSDGDLLSIDRNLSQTFASVPSLLLRVGYGRSIAIWKDVHHGDAGAPYLAFAKGGKEIYRAACDVYCIQVPSGEIFLKLGDLQTKAPLELVVVDNDGLPSSEPGRIGESSDAIAVHLKPHETQRIVFDSPDEDPVHAICVDHPEDKFRRNSTIYFLNSQAAPQIAMQVRVVAISYDKDNCAKIAIEAMGK